MKKLGSNAPNEIVLSKEEANKKLLELLIEHKVPEVIQEEPLVSDLKIIEEIKIATTIDKDELILSEIDHDQQELDNLLPEKTLRMCAFTCSSEDTKECLKCKRFFCVLHSSRISPNFCQDCFKHLALIVDKFERRVEDYDEDNDSVNVRKESCKRLRLDGPDWVFYTGWLDTLTDEEAQAVWEFHFFILKIIEHDNETRKIKNAAKLRGQKVVVGGINIKTTRDTKTRREAKPKDPIAELKKIFPGKTEEFYKQMVAMMQS